MGRETMYWKRYRAYARRRAAAQMALIMTPFLLIVGVGWTLQTSGYAPGDPRGDILWRLAVTLAFDAFCLAMAVYAVRWLIADRRGEKRPQRPEADRDGAPHA